MINKNIKRMLLFLTLIVLLIGICSATEVSKDTSTQSVSLKKVNTLNTQETINASNNAINKEVNKNVKTGNPTNTSTATKKNTKNNTIAKTYKTTADNYAQLASKINLAAKSNYTTYVINLKKGTYNATKNIIWDATGSVEKLVINANNSVINGQNKYHFITVKSDNTLEINNITLTKFTNDYGAAIENYGTLTVKNSKFTNNNVTDYGGAIYSSGELKIINSQFISNKAGDDGGAIYIHKSDDAVINRNNFTKNVAYDDGGAICLYGSYGTNITNNNFTKNEAYYGGAIANIPYSESYTYTAQVPYQVQRSRLEQYWNPVKNYGITGYTYSYSWNGFSMTSIPIPQYGYTGGYDYKTVYYYDTEYRSETRTGYRYYGSDTKIFNNEFIENEAYSRGGAIEITNGKVNITKNIFKRNVDETNYTFSNNNDTYLKNTYKYIKNSNPIYDDGETRVISNTIDDRKVSSITLNKISALKYGQTLKISGKLLNNKKAIKNQTLTINLNNKKYKVKTSNSGYFTLNTTANKVGTNNLTVSYAANSNYLATNNKTTFTVNKATAKLTLNKISQKSFKDNVTITGKFTTSEGKTLKNSVIQINVNGKVYKTKTNANGVYKRNIKINTVATNNITVSYAGNKNFNAVTNKTTFKTVKRATKVTVKDVATTKKGNKAIISGKLTDYINSPLMNTLVRVTVAGKSIDIKTNNNGVYIYKYKTTIAGTFNVAVDYLGNKNYKTDSTNTKLTVTN